MTAPDEPTEADRRAHGYADPPNPDVDVLPPASRPTAETALVTFTLEVLAAAVDEHEGTVLASMAPCTLPRPAAAALLRAIADTLDDHGPVPDRG